MQNGGKSANAGHDCSHGANILHLLEIGSLSTQIDMLRNCSC